ncbi:MAG: hypothetical protein O7A08_08700 [SAR324 cluster bacterium]|nr:hypothetical protein [SAR324 cluster bacterium]MCZ6843838.1 hypothetical protein [SAR324 cluster bacterium]
MSSSGKRKKPATRRRGRSTAAQINPAREKPSVPTPPAGGDKIKAEIARARDKLLGDSW